MAVSPSHLRIELAPKPGFCVKSTTLSPAVLPPPSPTKSPSNHGNSASGSTSTLLEPAPGPISVAKGQKVFVNIAWDPNVPPPPEGSEEAIQHAMQGADVDEDNRDGWYVPVIVSNARVDLDKSGAPSLVFDCVYNSTVKSRTLHDPDFKIFLIELALQRIEAQTGLALSRTIGTPNISSKGKLLPRTVQVPAALFPAFTGAPDVQPPSSSARSPKNTGGKPPVRSPLIQDMSAPSSAPPPDHLAAAATANPGLKNSLIQEVPPRAPSGAQAGIEPSANASAEAAALPGLRGILKKPAAGSATDSKLKESANGKGAGIKVDGDAPLVWAWTKDDAGRLRIEVHVPGLTTALVQQSTLDVEPRRIILCVPGRKSLDIDLALSDGEIVARTNMAHTSSPSPSAAGQSAKASAAAAAEKERQEQRKEDATKAALQLKRQRDLDVDKAEAKWELGSGMVVITV